MKFAKNFVSALNNALGFAVIKDDETIDEATARLEAMPTQTNQCTMGTTAEQQSAANKENKMRYEYIVEIAHAPAMGDVGTA